MNAREEQTDLDPVLDARGIRKSFGDLLVLDGISLTLRKREVVSILGPSGCGKSTLLHILSGLDRPGSGAVYLEGREITGYAGAVSYQQQKDLLLPWSTITDNVGLALELAGTGRHRAREIAEASLEEFGLAGFGGYYPHQLSGGMRQRAALLRTHLYSRSVMLLDEPFGALDTITRASMHDWLLDLLGRIETSVLLVTHDVEEAILLADRVIVLSPAPSRILETLEIAIPRPRDGETVLSEEFRRYKAALVHALSPTPHGRER